MEKKADFRKKEDQEKGTGFEIACNTCGHVSLSSHDRYCPFCGRGVIANFTAKRLDDGGCAYVTFKIDARFVARVPAAKGKSVDQILAEADNIFEEADFGQLEYFNERKPIIVEDEDGNFLWES